MKIMIQYIGFKEAGPIIALGMMRGLKENGIEVDAILLEKINNKDDWINSFREEDLFFIRTTPQKKKPFSTGVKTIKELAKLKYKFRNNTYDYIIRVFINPLDDLYSGCVHSKHIVNMVHDPVPHSGTPKKEADRYCSQLKKTKEAIVLTRSFIEQLNSYYSIPLSSIYYMRLGKMTTTSYGNKSYFTDTDPINFLFFGRIDKYKGINVLEEAFAILTKKYRNKVALIIAGSGDFSEYNTLFEKLEYTQLINRYIYDREIEGLFSKPNTVVVLPYLDASQSGVIPIAFDYNVPVIASNTGGLYEQLFEGALGTFFEVGDALDLYKKMARFVEDNNYWTSESNKMRKFNSYFDWKLVTKELLLQLKATGENNEGKNKEE